MKSARERAIDIARKAVGKGFSRSMFLLVIEDTGDIGKGARELIDAIAEGIEADRADAEKARAPS